MKANTKLNIEYSALLGLVWAANGVVFNFAAVYLQHRGYSYYALGLILALGNVISFLLQPLLAGYIDRRNKKPLLRSIFLAALLGALAAVIASLTDGSGLLQSAAYIVMIVVTALLQPLSNSASTYLCTWGYDIRFPRSRSVGSLCFAFAMFILGALCERFSPVSVSVSFALLMALMAALTALLLYQDGHLRAVPPKVFDNQAKAANSLIVFIRENRQFCVYLLGVVFLFFSHGIASDFLIEFIRPFGGDSADMGNILCIMALSEMPAMLLFDRLTRRISCRSMIRFSAVMFALKALVYRFAVSLSMLYAASCLQALSFAVLIPASVRYVELVIKKRDSVKGQSFTTGMFTLGYVLATYFGGLMLDGIGSRATLTVSVLAAFVGVAFVLPGVRRSE